MTEVTSTETVSVEVESVSSRWGLKSTPPRHGALAKRRARPQLAGCHPPDNFFFCCMLRFFTIDVCFFCLLYFLLFCIFSHKLCKWQVSMTFACWSMTLSLRSCQDPVNANVPCCDSFHLMLDIHDKSCNPFEMQFGNGSSATSNRWPLYRQ